MCNYYLDSIFYKDFEPRWGLSKIQGDDYSKSVRELNKIYKNGGIQ